MKIYELFCFKMKIILLCLILFTIQIQQSICCGGGGGGTSGRGVCTTYSFGLGLMCSDLSCTASGIYA